MTRQMIACEALPREPASSRSRLNLLYVGDFRLRLGRPCGVPGSASPWEGDESRETALDFVSRRGNTGASRVVKAICSGIDSEATDLGSTVELGSECGWISITRYARCA